MFDQNDESTASALPQSRAPELTLILFHPSGILHTALLLEHRPQQEKMANAVAASMHDDVPLIFEAGTGVGKSLAYLLPGIIHAMDQKRQFIVSTHTITLQEQLNQKDLPLCRKIFSADVRTSTYAEFKSAILFGKGNYLCTTRLANALKDKHDMFGNSEHNELVRIADWAKTTHDGLRHELTPPPSPEVWELVNADSSSCARKYCDCDRCFYQRARKRIRSANLIVINHSLLFSLIAGSSAAVNNGNGKGVLFADDFLVLDEAHTVPEVATDYFGIRLSSFGIDRTLKYLFNPKSGRGLFHKHRWTIEQQLVQDALDASHLFFDFLREKFLTKHNIVRIHNEGFAEDLLDGPLLALRKALRTRAEEFSEGRERDELLEQAKKIRAIQVGIRTFLSLSESDKNVYWLELSGRRQTIIALRSAPIDISPRLRSSLLERSTSVIFTSATLAAADKLEPFRLRIGGTSTLRAELQHSPFDFSKNMRVFIATDVPIPTNHAEQQALGELADYINFCTHATKGGTLVLFTSYTDMKRVAAIVEPIYRSTDRPFFIQGSDLSRTELARQFRHSGNGILFGTSSFWTGIDVPGDALSQVIITRLPFQVPTHPVLEARIEHIRDAGGNPFAELTLPEALITFRQGVGRLIRNQNDRGLITILDSRIVQKPYGMLFLQCLPQVRHIRFDRTNRNEVFKPFI